MIAAAAVATQLSATIQYYNTIQCTMVVTIPGRRDPLHCVSSQNFFLADSREFFLARVGAWVKGGVTNIWPVKPFETVMVIKGYTNKIELN